MKWLSSKALAKKEVAMACEVQLMYKPYYFYRKNVHFLYKVRFERLTATRPGRSVWSRTGLYLLTSRGSANDQPEQHVLANFLHARP